MRRALVISGLGRTSAYARLRRADPPRSVGDFATAEELANFLVAHAPPPPKPPLPQARRDIIDALKAMGWKPHAARMEESRLRKLSPGEQAIRWDWLRKQRGLP
jgi:hypothetical protein